VVAVPLDAEVSYRLSGRGDPVGNFFRPAIFDPDHHNRRHVRVRAGAYQRAEVQVQVGAKLQPPVGMRQRQRPLDARLDRPARRHSRGRRPAG
jgi:hypothetical protein